MQAGAADTKLTTMCALKAECSIYACAVRCSYKQQQLVQTQNRAASAWPIAETTGQQCSTRKKTVCAHTHAKGHICAGTQAKPGGCERGQTRIWAHVTRALASVVSGYK